MFDSNPDVIATYGDDPAVFILYNVKTKAKGTTPETVHLYAQQVDLDKKKLGERIDLMTESDSVINYEDGYECHLIAASDSAMLVAKEWKADDAGHVVLMLLRPGLTKSTVVRTIDHAEVDEHCYAKDATVYSGVHNGTYLIRDTAYHVYSVNDNKELTKFPLNFCRTGTDGITGGSSCDVTSYYRLKEGSYVVNTDTYGSDVEATSLIDAAGKTTRLSPLVKGYEGASRDMVQCADGSLVIWFHTNEAFQHDFHLLTLSTDFKPTEVLDTDQWKRLFGQGSGGFKGVNYLTRELYVQTTDEQIVVDESGKSTGSYTYLPVDDAFGATDHTAVKWMPWTTTAESGYGIGGQILTTGKAPTGSSVSLEGGEGSGSD